MSLQEKYQSILDLANSNGTTYELSEGDGVLHINATAPSAEAKQALWDEYARIDPNYASGDLVLDVTEGNAAGGGSNTYTVQHGDNLSAIGAKYGISWHAIYEANKDLIGDNPDVIHPGQELVIPAA